MTGEFPKWIVDFEGRRRIVQDEAQEMYWVKGPEPEKPSVVATPEPEKTPTKSKKIVSDDPLA